LSAPPESGHCRGGPRHTHRRHRRRRASSPRPLRAPKPSQPWRLARQGKRRLRPYVSRERALWHHPLVITGEAAGGGALPLPFPTAHAPTLMRATEARITRHAFVIFGDPGRVARPAPLDGYTSATSARTTHPRSKAASSTPNATLASPAGGPGLRAGNPRRHAHAIKHR
jgi:hypothetical protein